MIVTAPFRRRRRLRPASVKPEAKDGNTTKLWLRIHIGGNFLALLLASLLLLLFDLEDPRRTNFACHALRNVNCHQ
jgi:hypothetical protein